MPNVRPVFVFDTGETIAYGYWEPGNDPETVSAELMRLANASGDWTVPMGAAKQAVIEDTRQHFAQERDPEGEQWKELSGPYLRQKLKDGFPPDILIRTKEMFNVATSEDSWHTTERSIFFEPEEMPFYGFYHQFMPSKNPEKGLPRREFIGISDQCADEIEFIFGAWLSNLVEKEIPKRKRPPGGGVVFEPGMFVTSTKGFEGVLTNIPAIGGGFMVRGPLGRFVKGVFNI